MKNYLIQKYKQIKNFEILTDSGFSSFESIIKTKPQKCIKIYTKNNSIVCSTNHVFKTQDGLRFAKSLSLKDFLINESSNYEQLIKIKRIKKKYPLYEPLNIKNTSHLYYSNGVLSHNSFLGSSYTLIDYKILEGLNYLYPLENKNPFNDLFTDEIYEYIKVYKKPEPKHIYSMGVDVSRMTVNKEGESSKKADSISINILDITTLPYTQVCSVYIDEDFSYLQVPAIINQLAKIYNDAFIFIENNDTGAEIANITAFDYETDNVYFGKPGVPGFKTTKKTKRLGCDNLKVFLEKYKLTVNDYNTVSQLTTFVKKKDSYKAESSYQDDAVMSLIASLYFLQWKEFESFSDKQDMVQKLFDTKIVEKAKTEKAIEEDVPAFGFGPDDNFNESVF